MVLSGTSTPYPFCPFKKLVLAEFGKWLSEVQGSMSLVSRTMTQLSLTHPLISGGHDKA